MFYVRRLALVSTELVHVNGCVDESVSLTLVLSLLLLTMMYGFESGFSLNPACLSSFWTQTARNNLCAWVADYPSFTSHETFQNTRFSAILSAP